MTKLLSTERLHEIYDEALLREGAKGVGQGFARRSAIRAMKVAVLEAATESNHD